jgi:hypothetical protein
LFFLVEFAAAVATFQNAANEERKSLSGGAIEQPTATISAELPCAVGLSPC